MVINSAKTIVGSTLGLLLLFMSSQASANWWNCNGSLLLFSDENEVIETYENKVRAYLPLRVKVSNSLLNCGDQIIVESVDDWQLRFYGPNLRKNGKLLDSQFNRITRRNGYYLADLDERETQFWVRLQHYSFFPAGSYVSRVRVMILSEGYVVREEIIDMEYYSEPKISIELDSNSQGKVSGSGGDYHIDLGELQTGQQFNWGIKVLSNSAYDIVVDSEFNGLRHESNPNVFIDYSISFDNVKISSSEQLVRRYDYLNGVKNTWFGFAVELGSVELMPAGYYQDNLSLTVYPY